MENFLELFAVLNLFAGVIAFFIHDQDAERAFRRAAGFFFGLAILLLRLLRVLC